MLVLFLTILGSLFAAASIALFEGFVTPSTALFLTQGEYEILAGVLYVIAIIVYLGARDHPMYR